MVMYKYFIR